MTDAQQAEAMVSEGAPVPETAAEVVTTDLFVDGMGNMMGPTIVAVHGTRDQFLQAWGVATHVDAAFLELDMYGPTKEADHVPMALALDRIIGVARERMLPEAVEADEDADDGGTTEGGDVIVVGETVSDPQG